MHLQRPTKLAWLCCWLISSTARTTARSTVASTAPEQHGQDNESLATKPLLRPNGAESEARSSEAEASAYTVHRTDDIGAYVFGYDNAQDSSGNEHFRFEERFSNGTVIGEYGFTNHQNSVIVRVTYTADENGFRPIVNIEPLDNSRSPR